MLGQRLMFGRFVLDARRTTLFRSGTPIAVGVRGIALLHALLKANGQVLTKAELMDAAWPSVVVEESNLSVQIAALRKLLGPAPDGTEWIATVPRIGYRFTGAVAVDESGRCRPTPTEPPDSGLRPSVAVLPFDNLSNDTEQEYFADGITEDIILAISRFRWFFVIARNSSFMFKARDIDVKEVARKLDARYVLEGSVRKSGRQVRITAQLIDAGSAHQLWADRYDFDLGEIFAVQDRIAEQVAGAIEPELLKTESTLAAKRRRAGNVNAWDIVLQGTWFFHQVTRVAHIRARELFRQALELDPELPEANLWLARVNAGLVAYGWSDHEEDDLCEGVEAALRAVQIDGRNPYAHYALAIISVYSGALDRAIRAAEKALELSPSFALGHLVLGMARLSSGSAAEAIKPLEHGLHLNPYDPQNFVWYNVLALAHLFAGDPHNARETAAQALKVRPNWRPTLETLACCDALLGDLQAARVCVVQLAMLDKPEGDVFGPLRRQNPRWAEELAALLRKAGMREALTSQR
jgi:TolB-like protein/Tfp pilus assembly protein PilF